MSFVKQTHKRGDDFKFLEFVEDRKDDKDLHFYKGFVTRPFVDLRGVASHIEFNPVDPYQYLVVHSSKIDVYDDNDNVEHSYSRFGGVQHSANFRPDGSVICSGDEEGKIRILRLKSASAKRVNVPLRNIQGHEAPIHDVKFFGNDAIVAASDDKTASHWDVLTSQRIGSFVGHTDYVRSTCLVDNHTFATGSYDHTVKIWDSKSQSLVATFNHGKPVESIVKHPTAPILITSGGNYFKVWDLLTQKSTTFKTHLNTITALMMNSDGSRLFSGGLDGNFRVYNTNDFGIIHSTPYEKPILTMSITKDETRIVLGTNGGIIKNVREVKKSTRQVFSDDSLTTLNYRTKIQSFVEEMARQKSQSDIEATMHSRAVQKYLRTYEYKQAIDDALEKEGPLFIVSLLVELRNRGELVNAFESRDEVDILPILKFLIKHIGDGRYTTILTDVLHVLLDIYTVVLGNSSEVDRHFRILRKTINDEVRLQHELVSLRGSIDTLMLSSTLKNI